MRGKTQSSRLLGPIPQLEPVQTLSNKTFSLSLSLSFAYPMVTYANWVEIGSPTLTFVQK